MSQDEVWPFNGKSFVKRLMRRETHFPRVRPGEPEIYRYRKGNI